MNAQTTMPLDPLDIAWPPDLRAEMLAEAVAEARAVAAQTIAALLPMSAAEEAKMVEHTIAFWTRQHEAKVERVAEIVRSAEAAKNPILSLHLALRTEHSPAVAQEILRLSGSIVRTMPTGTARTGRLRAIRAREAREEL